MKMIIICLLLNLSFCYSQEIIKDSIFDIDNKGLYGNTILYDSTDLYIGAISMNIQTNYVNLIKIDRNFNILWNKSISGLWFDGEYTVLNNKIITQFCLLKYDSNNSKFYFHEYDYKGDVKSSIDTINLPLQFNTSKKLFLQKFNNNNYYFYQTSNDTNCKIKLVIYDTLFNGINEIDLHTINKNMYDMIYITNTLITQDSGFLLTGIYYKKSSGIYSLFLQKYSKDIQLEWQKTYNDYKAEQLYTKNAIQFDNGEFLVCGRYYPLDIYQSGYHTNFVKKFDINGKFILEKNYLDSTRINDFRIFKKNDNELFLLTNILNYKISDGLNSEYFWKFCIIKTDGDGNILWKKIWGEDSLQHILNDLAIINDNEIAVTGNYGNKIYIARLKDNAVGIQESWEKDEISVYPNPAKNLVTIIFPTNYKKIKPPLEIYNIIGLKIYEINFNELFDKKININITDYSAGIYFIKVANRIIKFIKI